MATKATKSPTKKPHNLPAALARNAAKAASEKRAEVLASGRDDIALVKEKMVAVTDAFYDIGLALQRLSAPGVATVLGYKGFGDLVTQGLGLSVSGANDLIEIVTWVTRKDALVWRREKSSALIELAKATPAEDTPSTLMKGPVKLASGRTFDPRKADAGAIVAAATEERRAHADPEKPGRGVTSTSAERAQGKRLEKGLHDAGLADARVTVLARPRGGSVVRIERIPLTKLDLLAKIAKAVHTA